MRYQILILCKHRTLYSSMLLGFFKKQNIEVKLILDHPCENRIEDDYICYDDSDLIKDGFINLGIPYPGYIKLKTPSAWDKAFYYLRVDQRFDHYYIIEDDVFCRELEIFIKLFRQLDNYDTDLITSHYSSQTEDPDWGSMGI